MFHEIIQFLRKQYNLKVFIKSAREAHVARFVQRIILNFRTPPRAPPFGGHFCARLCTKVSFFRFCPFFLIESKSIENTKKLSPQMINMCRKKCDFAKITKMAKNPFFILKGGNFFRHTLIIWGDNFFVFSILFDLIKKMGKIEKSHFRAQPIFSVFAPKMPKISIFMKKSFSNNFSMSNFGQKMFELARAILLRRVRYQPFRLKFWTRRRNIDNRALNKLVLDDIMLYIYGCGLYIYYVRE